MSKKYCQAQPQLQLNLAKVSFSLQISTPPTHPTTRESSEVATSSCTFTVNQVRVNLNLNPNFNRNLNLNPNLNPNPNPNLNLN